MWICGDLSVIGSALAWGSNLAFIPVKMGMVDVYFCKRQNKIQKGIIVMENGRQEIETRELPSITQ